MSRAIPKKVSQVVVFLIVFTVLTGFGINFVEAEEDLPITSVNAPAPVIEPTVENENNQTKVLFDNTHGQTKIGRAHV